MNRSRKLLAAAFIAPPAIYALRKYCEGATCRVDRDLSNEVVIVTGSSAGIGKELAREIARRNATVVFANRHPDKTLNTIEEIQKDTGNKRLEYMHVDLEELKSVKAFAEEFLSKHDKLNILVNNGGQAWIFNRKESKDGYERQFAVNHLAAFYLERLLFDTLNESKHSRIINTASFGHWGGKFQWDDLQLTKPSNYSFLSSYGQAMLSKVATTKLLQTKLGDNPNVKAMTHEPGFVRSDATRYMGENFSTKILEFFLWCGLYTVGKTANQGAQTALYLALEDWNKLVGGAVYEECQEAYMKGYAVDENNQKRIWAESERLIRERVGEDWLNLKNKAKTQNQTQNLTQNQSQPQAQAQPQAGKAQ